MAFTGRMTPTKFASENWWAAKCNELGVLTGEWEAGGIRISNSIEFARPSAEEKKSETDKGYLIKAATVGGSATLKIKMFRTTTKALIDLAVVNANDRYALVLEVSEGSRNGKFEYIYIPIAQITGNFSLGNSEETDLEFMCSPVTAETTTAVTAGKLVGAKKEPTSLVCRKDLSFDVIEMTA